MQKMNTDRVEMSRELSAFVADRIANFIVECDENRRWLGLYVEKHRMLPLFVDWIETIGITSDGLIRKFSADGDLSEYEGVRRIDDVGHFIGALVQGARRHPELRALIPTRPDDAVACEACRGMGLFPSNPGLLCECGGVGWKAPHNNSLKSDAAKPRTLG